MRARADRVVEIARSWIGTPYHHQMTVQGAGCDCLGLVRGIWRELFGAEPVEVPAYTEDWSEPQGEEVLWTVARSVLVEKSVDNMKPGDVLLFRMRERSVAKHLGVLVAGGRDPRFVHAYQRHGVIESPLSEPWRKCVVSCFAFPS